MCGSRIFEENITTSNIPRIGSNDGVGEAICTFLTDVNISAYPMLCTGGVLHAFTQIVMIWRKIVYVFL